MQQFARIEFTANYSMLESYFERLFTYTTLSLVRPTRKIPSFDNCTLLFPGIMSLNHNKNKIMNVIRNYNDKISVVFWWNFRCLRSWPNLSITGQRLLCL